jgi:hypothetical protein
LSIISLVERRASPPGPTGETTVPPASQYEGKNPIVKKSKSIKPSDARRIE